MRLSLLLLVACTEAVNPEPLGDYTQWKRFDVLGPAPGHSDTYRIIYANDLAVDPAQSFRLGYQEGAIVVKEIRTNEDGEPGALSYVAIMRRLELEGDDGGWLFSESDTPNGPEHTAGFCWARCHVAAPYNGAWYDYRD
jgi:hypothetical protein